MAKVHVLLFVVAVLPILNGYPLLEEDTSSVSTDSSNDHTPHNLQVNPLVAKQTGQENNEDVSKSNENTPKKDDDSTDSSYIEETYIEVLLPGTPQINSSVLESLLAHNTNTTDADRPTRGATDSPSQKEGQIGSSSTSRPLVPVPYSQQAIETRRVRDSSSEKDDDSKTDSSEKNSKPAGEDLAQSHGSTLRPVLYASLNSAQNVKRETDSEKDTSSSDERSSEEKPNESHISTGLLSSSPASTPQSSNSRVVRDTSNKQNENKHEPAQFLATSGSDLEKARHESSSTGSPVVKEKASTASTPILSAQQATQTRQVRDSSSRKDDDSEEDSSKPAGVVLIPSHSSTIRPSLYSSENGAQNVKSQTDSKKDINSSDEAGSSEEKVNKPHILSNYPALTPQSSNSRVVRNTVNKQNDNEKTQVSAAPERNIEKATDDASTSSSLSANTLTQSQRNTIRPALYSSGAQNVKRGIDSKEDISSLKKGSSEDRENKPHTATGLLPSSPISTAQGSEGQVAIRNTNIAGEQNTNKNEPQNSASPGRNTEKGIYESSSSSSLSVKGQLGYSTTGRPSVIVPIPYSQQAIHARPVREASSEEDDDSKEESSEEKSKPSVEGLTQDQITNGPSSQVSKTRVVRKASDRHNVNTSSSPQVSATSGSNSYETKYESSSEHVVFVTPQVKRLN